MTTATNSWERFLERVKSRVSINTYTTWFQPTKLHRAEGENLFVQIPSTVFRQVLTRTYGEIVKAVFHELGTPNVKVQYVCNGGRARASRPGNIRRNKRSLILKAAITN